MSTPPMTNPFRAKLPIVAIGALVFVVLLVATAITENNAMGTVVAIYGIVGGILLGRLLAATERDRAGANDA